MGSHLWKWMSTNIHWVYNRKSVNLSILCLQYPVQHIHELERTLIEKFYLQGLLSVVPKVKQKTKVPGAFSQMSQWGTALDPASSNRICLLANLLQPWTCASTLSVLNPAHNSLSLSLSLPLSLSEGGFNTWQSYLKHPFLYTSYKDLTKKLFAKKSTCSL
jgi:hypothetical protein